MSVVNGYKLLRDSKYRAVYCEYVITHHGTCFLTSGFGCELPLMQSTQVLKSDN